MKQIFNFCGKYLNEKKGILTLYILICIFGSMTMQSSSVAIFFIISSLYRTDRSTVGFLVRSHYGSMMLKYSSNAAMLSQSVWNNAASPFSTVMSFSIFS